MERQSSLQNASRRGRGHNNGGGNRGLKEQSPHHPGNDHDNNIKSNANDNDDNKGAPNQNQQSSHKPVKRNDNKSNALSGAHSQNQQSSHKPVKHQYRINPNALPDEKLSNLSINDPRGDDPTRRITKKANKNGNGRNTESFDPASTLVRPDVRVWVGSKDKKTFDKPLKHDDVVIVPELFGDEDDWEIYYKLVEEMNALQKENVKGSEYISWHEGAHLIVKNPKGSPTFEKVIDRLCEYFNIQKKSAGTRFNWYRDSSDWKPFHHDSAAYNPQRAKTQNITVGVSFGAMRELAFLRATPQENGDKVKMYFPQTNNGVFSFGRDVNILFKHGINALPEEEQDGKGRISIILWGLAEGVLEEEGSPPLLGSDGQGPHAQRRDGRYGNGGRGRGRGRR